MKCEQCGFLVDSLPEGGGEYLCPNCGWVMRKGAPDSAGDGKTSPTDTATATHLKIARTVNVGFGDFASVLAATDASRIAPTDTRHDVQDRTRTASASTLTVEEPDDDDVLSTLEVYDEDDEYARIQADIAARKASLDERSAELDNREKYLNKKLEEIIAEKEFLRTGIEKNDEERASYLKQKNLLDTKRSDLEKEMAARKASLDARAAEIERKSESLAKTRAALEELKRELDTSLTGEQPIGDATGSSVSIPYSAKLLRQNNSLKRTVRIQNRIVICLAVLVVVLVVLLFIRESELRRARTAPEQKPPAASIGIIGGADGPTAVFLASELLLKEQGQSAESDSTQSAAALNSEKLPAPENTSGGGL